MLYICTIHIPIAHSINMHDVLGPDDLRLNTYCTYDLGVSYSTKEEAVSVCEKMQIQHNNCTTIFDKWCDGVDYRICKERSHIYVSSKLKGSCTYSIQGMIYYQIPC